MKSHALFVLLAGWIVAGPGLDAQTAPSSSGARSASADEVVQLTVFEVAADRDDSYGSTTSTSLTGTRKEMRRLPVSAEVMNRALLDDLGALELQEMLKFAPGVSGPLVAGGSSDPQGNKEGDLIGAAVGQIHGLNAGASRNGLLIDIGSFGSFDGFSKDRIEIIRGPQGLLYGPTSVAGITVVNTKRPSFQRDSLRASVRTDSEGSLRGEVEANVTSRVAGTKEQKVALLMTSFRDHSKYWRVNNEVQSQGTYLAGAWRVSPKLTLRADYERWKRLNIAATTIRLAAPVSDPTYGSRNNRPLRLLLAQGRSNDLFAGGLSYANADSLFSDMFAEPRNSQVFSSQAEITVAPWLSVLVQGGYSKAALDRLGNGGTGLTPPNLSGNPTGDWAVQLTPTVNPQYRTERVWRTLANITLPAWRFMKNELSVGMDARINTQRQLGERWFEIDAQGEFIRNATALNNGFSGRTLMPNIWWAPRTQGFDGPQSFRAVPANVIELNGRRYRRDFVRNQFSQFVTADNPLGFSNGYAGVNWTDTATTAGYAALNTEWLDGRIDTLAGYRIDALTSKLLPHPQDNREFREPSYLYGLNWHLSKQLTAYVVHSTSFQPATGLTTANTVIPPGRGIGNEAGLKFSLLDSRISGVVNAFSGTGKNNQANLATEVKNVVDYSSQVNGRSNGGGAFVFNHETRGYEVLLTAAPLRGLRVQAGFTKFTAKDTDDAYLPIYYNDQFNVNAAGQVTLGNGGSPLLVPISPNTTGWNPASPTPGVPSEALTMQILRNGDANGNYRANLDPVSGTITNAGALYLNTPTVGTGVTGLPVSQHQLGFTPPSGQTFLVRKGGDLKTGNSPITFSLTGNYKFPEGRLRGLGFGGNYRFGRDSIAYYYTDLANSNPAARVRKPFYMPDQQFVTLFASYEWRIKGRYTLRTQINVTNALNEMKTVIFPNVATGAPDNATLTNAPRVWAWTNSVRF